MFKLEYDNFDSTLNMEWPFNKDGLDYFQDTINNDIVFVAEYDNRIIAYLAGYIMNRSYLKEKRAELDNMLVDDEYHKLGIGSMLITEFKNYCRNNKVESIVVTASAKNKKAIAFYLKNHFEEWDITLKCEL